jgi:hypothetical protein
MDTRRSEELNLCGQIVAVLGLVASGIGIIGMAADAVDMKIAGAAIGAGIILFVIGEVLKGLSTIVKASEFYLSRHEDQEENTIK